MMAKITNKKIILTDMKKLRIHCMERTDKESPDRPGNVKEQEESGTKVQT